MRPSKPAYLESRASDEESEEMPLEEMLREEATLKLRLLVLQGMIKEARMDQGGGGGDEAHA